MKTYAPKNCPNPPHFILTGLIVAAATFALVLPSSAQSTNNPISAFPVTVDGRFTGGVVGGFVVGEWSDVTPVAFFSSPGASAVPVALNDPTRNSLLYAALAMDTPTTDPSLYLMYDFLPNTGQITPGQIFASVAFPIHLPQALGGPGRTQIAVLFKDSSGSSSPEGTAAGIAGNFFDVFVDLDLDGSPDRLASELGITGSAGFGPSTLSSTSHLLVELKVPLRIPANFASPGSPIPGNGINPATGQYDPDPAFWGAAGGSGTGGGRPSPEGEEIAAEPGLQPASAGLFTINPNGSTTITPVPEPATSALLLAGLSIFAARRRRTA